MRVVVFEDAFVDQLAPLTLGRAAYAVGCGGESLATWISRLGGRTCGLVRPYLRAWQAANYPSWSDDAPAGETMLLINARLIPSPHTYDVLRRLYHRAECGQVRVGDHLAAAVLPDDVAAPCDAESLQQFLRAPAVATLPRLDEDLSLLALPHEIIHWHLATLADSLTYRIAQGTYREIRDGVFVGAGVHLSEWVYTDTSQGPIVIDSDCTIRPFACISGPARLGERSRVNEHASLRPGVSLGPVCKVGGEVEASVLDEYSNKQHAGYLGHSYLGPWVNLGAGTSNSNLKNSYGSVRMEIAGQTVDTGLQMLGCVVGDYARTAVNTSIFTGKLIGACSMVYGTVTANVPSFVNYAQSLGEVTDLPPDVMARTQKRVFQRRGMAQLPWHVQLLRDMYQQAAVGRQLADRPLSL